MKTRSGEELYEAGVARREREAPDLTIDPEGAEAVRMARHGAAVENNGVARSDGIGEALAEAARSGRTASFLESYKGPLSETVLADLLEAGTILPGAA